MSSPSGVSAPALGELSVTTDWADDETGVSGQLGPARRNAGSWLGATRVGHTRSADVELGVVEEVVGRGASA